MIVQVALVSQSSSVNLSDVTAVSAALQKQTTRDLAPIWNVEATVDAFGSLAQVPIGYWPIVIRDDVIQKQRAAGIHLDQNGQPFALVQASADWPLTASHECLEMLVDPFGNRLVAGQAPKQVAKAAKQGRVEYLVEVCDPSEADQFGYSVNGIQLSDFYTPSFFDPVTSPNRYSFTAAITKPRTILRGGYISWHHPINDHWYQLQWFSTAKPVLADLGVFDKTDKRSLREIIDSRTITPRMKRQRPLPRKASAMLMARGGAADSSSARAGRLEEYIQSLL